MNKNISSRILLTGILLIAVSVTALSQEGVQMSEKNLNIKTYVNSPADVNPVFYDGLNHQGVTEACLSLSGKCKSFGYNQIHRL